MKRIASILILLLCAFPAVAQKKSAAKASGAAKPAVPRALPKVEFEKYTLPNGMDVILHVDRKLPIVHVNEWFHVGSKNEKRGRTGFAHLFEHLMFQGSKNASGEYFTYAEKAGANLREGGVNGTTNNDRTNYFVTAPSGSLEFLLWLEADRLATLPDVLTKEKLDNQRDVVKNERRQGLENVPYGRWFKLLAENLYPADHPYSWTVIGSHEDLTAATLDDVKEFFRTYYTPNNLSLVIAGDFDPAEAKRLVNKYFGSLPPGPALDRPAQNIATLDREKIVEAEDRVPQERVYMIWPTAELFAPDEAKLDLAAGILADGLSSRLQKVLVYDNQLASDVSAFQWSNEIAGQFIIQATARPGGSLEKIEEIITAEISRLAKGGPTTAELTRAKNKQEYNFITGLERIGGFGGKADLLNSYNTYLGDPNKFEWDLSRYRSVTTSDVREATAKWIDNRKRVLIRFRPETSTRAPAAAEVDRAKQPALGADRAFKTPDVQSAKLENGMEVFVVERRDLPKVATTFVTRAGTIGDPGGKEGVANMVIRTIDRGTKTRSALELEDELGNLGTSLTGFAGREASQISVDVLKANLDAATEILADVVLNPQFPADEFEREQKLQLDTLAQQSKNPNALIARIRPMLLFGATHPYGRPALGLPSTVKNITRDDLRKFHEAWWKPGSSAIVFAGDVTLEEATRIARKYFSGWTGGAAPVISVPPPQPAAAGKIYIVDRQDAAQTVIAQSLPAPARTASDFYALRLADAVWGGGGFGTRLNLNLREEKGYSYGVFSNQVLYSRGGLWSASGGVQTNKTKESLIEFINELNALAGQRPITAAELETAKLVRVRGYAQQFESLGRIAGQVAEMWVLGLPMTELQREPEETMKMTLEAVNAAARKYAIPSSASVLLVGDLGKIEEGVRETKSGEVVVLDVEGNVLKK
ncbi:MAG TPA: pitrilysin family protein [Thermoanaerobaculia bacterium]|nr:pitrilysin family protein [Thermoanaerobaculia bacterium]